MANLATLSHKETFMKDLDGFMSKNQPKFVDLYQNLLVRSAYNILISKVALINSLLIL